MTWTVKAVVEAPVICADKRAGADEGTERERVDGEAGVRL